VAIQPSSVMEARYHVKGTRLTLVVVEEESSVT
jgi:hypothetical protein